MKTMGYLACNIGAAGIIFCRRRSAFLALGIIVSILVTACSGAVSLPGSPPDAPAADQNAHPGTEEFGLSKQGLVESIEAVESIIATCMGEAGFEYIAADYNTVRKGMVADKSLPGLSERQYINQFGYGISTLYTGHAPQLTDAAIPAQIGLGKQNVQLFRNLSPADQIAYNRTLFGENSDATFAVAVETEDFLRIGGCTRTAVEQIFAPEQLNISYLNPKDALIEQDPRMMAAIVDFGECMRAAGFDYNHEREIEPDLRNRLYAITEGAPVESLSDDAQTALAALQVEEQALAVVALDCETRILDPVEDQVERELFARRDQQ